MTEEIKIDPARKMWDQFIAHLNVVQPMVKDKKTGENYPHKNFIGSIKAYEKIFLEANS